MISIVDDDPSARESLVDLVKSMGFSAEAFQSAEEFLQSGLLRDTSCLIADVQMPGITGLELHTSIVRSDSAIPTILITAFPNEKDGGAARRSGAPCAPLPQREKSRGGPPVRRDVLSGKAVRS